MKHILSNTDFHLNEYRNFPITPSTLMILKNDIEHKLQCGDILIMQNYEGEIGNYLFNFSEDGKLNVLDYSDDKYKFFDLDLLGKKWEILSINGQKVVVE